jgi:hypothetical protein
MSTPSHPARPFTYDLSQAIYGAFPEPPLNLHTTIATTSSTHLEEEEEGSDWDVIPSPSTKSQTTTPASRVDEEFDIVLL